MKSIRKNARLRVLGSIFTLGALLILTSNAPSTQLRAQSTFTLINPPPCDFNDNFYTENGIVIGQGTGVNAPVAGRFGTFRQTGPPAFQQGQVNWVADSNCSINDPTRRNFRILATTGAYRDDDASTQFFSIIAFLVKQTDDFIGVANKRNIQMVNIVSNFEAYAAVKQVLPNGHIASTPCGSLKDPTDPNLPDCFSVGTVPFNGGTILAVATPNLRQDWRVSSNRNAIDNSDNNLVNGSGSGAIIVNNAPFGYFCDDLLGMWIVTYFWYNANAVGAHVPATVINPNTGLPIPNPCPAVLGALANKNGINLDGTPIVKTGDELHFVEGVPGAPPVGGVNPPVVPCGVEGNLDPGGSDGGAVWIVCPTILDPRNGAIATDAFLDVVRRNGGALDPNFQTTFTCLQSTGKFCNEAAPEN